MVPKVAVDVDDEVTCDVVIVNGDEDDCDEELRVELELIAGTDPSRIVNASSPIFT